MFIRSYDGNQYLAAKSITYFHKYPDVNHPTNDRFCVNAYSESLNIGIIVTQNVSEQEVDRVLVEIQRLIDESTSNDYKIRPGLTVEMSN